ncbi:unnamed protein product [Lota lota]
MHSGSLVSLTAAPVGVDAVGGVPVQRGGRKRGVQKPKSPGGVEGSKVNWVHRRLAVPSALVTGSGQGEPRMSRQGRASIRRYRVGLHKHVDPKDSCTRVVPL